jgi:hypothetical protein
LKVSAREALFVHVLSRSGFYFNLRAQTLLEFNPERSDFVEGFEQAIPASNADTLYFEKTLSGSRRSLREIFCCVARNTEKAEEKADQDDEEAANEQSYTPVRCCANSI